MNKIIVICNEHHEITEGQCAFCERDRERVRLAGVQIALDGSGPPAAPTDWAYTPVQDAALHLRASLALAELDARRYRTLRAMVGVLNVELGRILDYGPHSFTEASAEQIRCDIDRELDARAGGG